MFRKLVEKLVWWRYKEVLAIQMLAVGLSAEIRVAHIMMAKLLSALPKPEQAKIKAELREFLAEGVSKMGSEYPPHTQQLYRNTVAGVIQALLSFEPEPEDASAGLDHFFRQLREGSTWFENVSWHDERRRPN